MITKQMYDVSMNKKPVPIFIHGHMYNATNGPYIAVTGDAGRSSGTVGEFCQLFPDSSPLGPSLR